MGLLGDVTAGGAVVIVVLVLSSLEASLCWANGTAAGCSGDRWRWGATARAPWCSSRWCCFPRGGIGLVGDEVLLQGRSGTRRAGAALLADASACWAMGCYCNGAVVLVALVLLLTGASAWLATGCYCKGAVVLVALVLLSSRRHRLGWRRGDAARVQW
jgi:hypothetical protein